MNETNTTTIKKLDKMEDMNNLDIYNQCREVPQNDCKTIQDGKLKGKTDINPMWRIQKLTELFGPCGFGWFITDVEQWLETCQVTGRDGSVTTEVTAYVKLALLVKIDGNWSERIIGIGGSKLSGKGQGDQANDECYKMAYTDAISVACKMLGMGADIYWSADSTKYTQGTTAPTQRREPVLTEEEKNNLDLAIQEIKEAKSLQELNDVAKRWSGFYSVAAFVQAGSKRKAELSKN